MALSLYTKLGRTISRLRQDAGLSQERLANMAKIHRTFVGKLERGDQRDVGLLVVERIAKALKMTASELIREAERGEKG